MSNNYCHTSVLIPFTTEEEKAWLQDQLTLRADDFCNGCKHEWGDCVCIDNDESWEACGGWEFEETTTNRGGDTAVTAMWVTEREYVDGFVLAQLVADYQQTFDRQDFWECRFAFTADRQEVDAFDGHKVLVYRGKVHYLGTDQDLVDLACTLPALNDFAHTLPLHL